MNEKEVEKADLTSDTSFQPKRGSASRYFRNYIRKRKIKRIYETK